MRIPALFGLPLFGGCLLNFSPFNEDAFLVDYESTLCNAYLDCLDGSVDGTLTANQEALNSFCTDYVRTPQQSECQILEDRAVSCYEELTALSERLVNESDCSVLNEDSILPTCRVTYIDCPTDAPFGTMPAGAPSSQPPTVDRIDSLHGPTTGGNQITFTGTGFDAETRIQFAGNWGEVVSVAADGTQATVTVPAGNKGTSNINIVNSVGNVLLDTLMYTYWEDIGDQSTGLLAILDYSRDVGGYWDETENSTGSAFFWENTATPETMNPIEWYQYLGMPGVNTCTWNVSQAGVSGAPIDTEYELLRFTSETGTSFEIPASSGGDGWLPSFDRSSLPALEPGRRYTLTTEYANGWPALSIDNILTGPRAIAITYPDIATPKDEVPIWDLSQPVVWNQSATNDDYVLLSFTTETGDTLSCAGQDNGLLFLDDVQQAPLQDQLFEVTGCRVNRTVNSPTLPINNGWATTMVRYCVRGLAYGK